MNENDEVKNIKNLKLIIVGNAATGKTSLVESFTNNSFIFNTFATVVPNNATKVIKIIELIFGIFQDKIETLF